MFTDDEEIVEALKNRKNGTDSMRVVGRGTLVKSARSAREGEAYKNLLNNADSIMGRKKSK